MFRFQYDALSHTHKRTHTYKLCHQHHLVQAHVNFYLDIMYKHVRPYYIHKRCVDVCAHCIVTTNLNLIALKGSFKRTEQKRKIDRGKMKRIEAEMKESKIRRDSSYLHIMLC